jgi:hypothetical protein
MAEILAFFQRIAHCTPEIVLVMHLNRRFHATYPQRIMHAVGTNIPSDELLKYDVKSICAGGKSISVKVNQLMTTLSDVEEAELGGKLCDSISCTILGFFHTFLSKAACFLMPE